MFIIRSVFHSQYVKYVLYAHAHSYTCTDEKYIAINKLILFYTSDIIDVWKGKIIVNVRILLIVIIKCNI